MYPNILLTCPSVPACLHWPWNEMSNIWKVILLQYSFICYKLIQHARYVTWSVATGKQGTVIQWVLLLKSHNVRYKCRGLLGHRLSKKRLPWIILEKGLLGNSILFICPYANSISKNWQEAIVSEARSLRIFSQKKAGNFFHCNS